MIDTLQDELKLLDKEVTSRYKENKDILSVKSTPGFGDYLSLMVVGEICTIQRFSKCKQYLAYCGLVPSVRQSGEFMRMGSIRKDSNRNLRWAYIQAAWIAIRHDTELPGIFNHKSKQKNIIEKLQSCA